MLKKLNNKKTYFAVLALIFVVAFLLRLWHIGKLDLWRDETFTTILAQKSIVDLIKTTASDTNAPLHQLFLHFWVKMFGTSEISIRFPSLLASFGSVVYLFFITKEFFNKKAQLAITLLYSTSVISIFYAREARAYGILFLVFTASVYHLLKLTKNFNKKDAVLYIIFTVLSFYTHNLALFFIPCEFIYLIIKILQNNKIKNIKKLIKKNKKIILKWIYVFTAIFLCASPWIIISFTQAQKVEESFWLGFDPTNSVNETLTGLATGIRLLHHETFTLFDALLNWSVLILLMIGTSFELINLKKEKFIVSVFFWVPFIFIYFISFKRPLLYMRYLSFLSPFLFILVFKGIRSVFSSKFVQITLSIIISILSLNVYFSYLLPDNDSKAHYESMTTYIQTNLRPRDHVLNADSLSFFSTRFYLDKEVKNTIYDPENTTPYYVGKALMQESDFTRHADTLLDYDRIWVVELYNKTERPYLEKKFHLVEERYFEGNLYLQLWIRSDSQNYFAQKLDIN